MRYTVTTFKVRLEVCDVGERIGASEDVVRVARPIFAEHACLFLLLLSPGPGTYTLVRNMSGLNFRGLPLSPATECLIRNEETL